ncbi:MAG: DUF5671 domain-containing protein [Acidobacteriota bacterium]|nr:DUF5671 domain-containing protein [Acidobacteriota bacterium]
MAVDDDLIGFVRDALGRGATRADIDAVLRRAGWDAAQVAAALDTFAAEPFIVPVPRPRVSLSARDAFLYLVLFSTLYLSAVNFGGLVFDLINRAFPDPVLDGTGTYRASGDGLRWAIASLIVSFPVFLFVSRVTSREIARDRRKRESAVRRWLTYLTLFIAASVLIADVIVLVYNALGGDMTMRFVLKVLTVGLVAGLIFGHYLKDLRADEKAADG